MGSLFDVEKRQIINRYFSEAKHGPLARLPDEFSVDGPARPSLSLKLGLGEIVPAHPRGVGEGGAVVSSTQIGEGTVPALRGGTTLGAGVCTTTPGAMLGAAAPHSPSIACHVGTPRGNCRDPYWESFIVRPRGMETEFESESVSQSVSQVVSQSESRPEVESESESVSQSVSQVVSQSVSLNTQRKMLDGEGLFNLSNEGEVEKVFSKLARGEKGSGREEIFLGLENKGANSIRRAARRRRKDRKREDIVLKSFRSTKQECLPCSCGGLHNTERTDHCTCSCYLLRKLGDEIVGIEHVEWLGAMARPESLPEAEADAEADAEARPESLPNADAEEDAEADAEADFGSDCASGVDAGSGGYDILDFR